MRWMVMRLHAPLASFGREIVDERGLIANAPAKSMITGLLANALGWERTMHQEHQALQERLVFACVWEHEHPRVRLTDYQTAQLGWKDRAWTSDGQGGTRRGTPTKYAHGGHQRWRDYHSDLRVAVVVRLEQPDQRPTLDDLAEALARPRRPLYIGRKCCLPARPIFDGWVEAVLARGALETVAGRGRNELMGFWTEEEGGRGTHRHTVTDERDWRSGLHGGSRTVWEGTVERGGAPQ